MKLTAWAFAGLVVGAAVIYYAVKPTTKFTFYDPEVIRAGTVGDPPNVMPADEAVDTVTG
ncbi:MAG TPA: hypothetical protein VIF11_15845 [Methylomirabilota bacterium]|jgi:hypothetical protein